MCGSIFLGIFLGVLALKAARRFAYYHRYGGGCGSGHGCASGHGCGHANKRFLYYRWGGQYGRGGYGGEDGAFGIHGNQGQSGARPATKSISEVLRGLELNERQRQEAAPVLALAQEWLGPAGPRIEAALLAVGSERFEPVLVEGLLEHAPEPVRRELLEGLEHLHTILISEQREQLRNQLSRSKPASGSAPSGSTGGGSTPV